MSTTNLDPRCPHGCGTLDPQPDFYICPECGDEWAVELFDDDGSVADGTWLSDLIQPLPHCEDS